MGLANIFFPEILNRFMLHHSEFGLIVQLLPRFQRLNKIRVLSSSYVAVDLLRIHLQLRDDVYTLH